jgi:pre-rRNA-processing protein TSR2
MSTSTSTQPAPSAPSPTSILFARGVIARLSVWPVIRIAIQESLGGPGAAKKVSLIASEVLDAFESSGTSAPSGIGSGPGQQQQPPPDDQYIEELLLQILSDEFDTSVEDGSGEAVAVDICRIHESLSSSDVNQQRKGEELVKKFEEMADKVKGKRVEAKVVDEARGEEGEWEDDDDKDEGSDEEMEDGSQMQPIPELIRRREEPEVDEDGFTMVKGKGKRHG